MMSMKKRVKAKPNAQKQHLIAEHDGSLTAHLKSPPVNLERQCRIDGHLAPEFVVPKANILNSNGGILST